MSLRARLVLAAVAAASVTVGILAGGAGALDLMAGLALGGLTIAGLASITGVLRHGRGKVWQVLLLGIHLLKYPLILIVLYLLITTLQRDPLLLVGGYTLAVAACVLHLARQPLRRPAAG